MNRLEFLSTVSAGVASICAQEGLDNVETKIIDDCPILLVVHTDKTLSMNEHINLTKAMKRLQGEIQEHSGKKIPIVICDGGLDIKAIYDKDRDDSQI